MKTSSNRKFSSRDEGPKVYFSGDGLMPSGAVVELMSREFPLDSTVRLEKTGDIRPIEKGEMYAIGDAVYVATFSGGEFPIVRAVLA